jgi:hypothetical protein
MKAHPQSSWNEGRSKISRVDECDGQETEIAVGIQNQAGWKEWS